MKAGEMFRLVFININQNKFKTIMTSIGLVAGAATIVLVIAIGKGGQRDVAEQFSSLNAGAIDVTFEYAGAEDKAGAGGLSFGNLFAGLSRSGSKGGEASADSGSKGARTSRSGGDGAAMMPGEGNTSGRESRSRPENGQNGGAPGRSGEENAAPGNREKGSSAGEAENDPGQPGGEEAEETEEGTGDLTDDRMNQERITLTEEDVEDVLLFVPGITGATISYMVRADVEGAELTQAQSCSVAGVKEEYFSLSRLNLAAGELFAAADDESCSRVCVLGSSRAKDLFGSPEAAVGAKLYLADRAYSVMGVLESSQTVSAGISPDEGIFVPYRTGIKYIAGNSVDPVLTVIAEDVDLVEAVEEDVQAVLSVTYENAEFSFSDAGSKMKAAESSNRILTMLLTAMAVIVFLVGGIGIMNVLFVSVKERTGEIGVLKALGASRGLILGEFLAESAGISLIGGTLGVGISLLILPLAEFYGMRTELTLEGCLTALVFAVLTGTVFGIYPAWKASRLVPVEALNAE